MHVCMRACTMFVVLATGFSHLYLPFLLADTAKYGWQGNTHTLLQVEQPMVGLTCVTNPSLPVRALYCITTCAMVQHTQHSRLQHQWLTTGTTDDDEDTHSKGDNEVQGCSDGRGQHCGCQSSVDPLEVLLGALVPEWEKIWRQLNLKTTAIHYEYHHNLIPLI